MELLRDHYDGALDEERAAAFLENVRNLDEEDGEALKPIIERVRDHGQSLDWIFDGDPSRMICKSAARSDAADSTLVELGRQFEQVQPEYLAALHAFNEKSDLAHDLAWERAGWLDPKRVPTNKQGKPFMPPRSKPSSKPART